MPMNSPHKNPFSWSESESFQIPGWYDILLLWWSKVFSGLLCTPLIPLEATDVPIETFTLSLWRVNKPRSKKEAEIYQRGYKICSILMGSSIFAHSWIPDRVEQHYRQRPWKNISPSPKYTNRFKPGLSDQKSFSASFYLGIPNCWQFSQVLIYKPSGLTLSRRFAYATKY